MEYTSKEEVLEAYRNGEYVDFENLREELRFERDIVLEAVKHQSAYYDEERGVLSFTSEELRGDKEIVLEAVKHNGNELIHASETLREDGTLVLEAARNLLEKYDYGEDSLANYAELDSRQKILKVLERYPQMLGFLSKRLRNDKEIVLQAVSREYTNEIDYYAHVGEYLDEDRIERYSALVYASEELRGDKEVVLAAIKNCYSDDPFNYMSEKLKGDREFILLLGRVDGKALLAANEELRGDKDFVLEVVKLHGFELEYASEELRGDKEVVLEAVKKSCWALEYASEELKGDREVVMEAVKQYGEVLMFASKELGGDKELILEAVKSYGGALEYASEELKGDREIVKVAAQKSFEVMDDEGYPKIDNALKYASEELKSDMNLILELVDANNDDEYFLGDIMRYVNEDLRNNLEFWIELASRVSYEIDDYMIGKYTTQILQTNAKGISREAEALRYERRILREQEISRSEDALEEFLEEQEKAQQGETQQEQAQQGEVQQGDATPNLEELPLAELEKLNVGLDRKIQEESAKLEDAKRRKLIEEIQNKQQILASIENDINTLSAEKRSSISE